MSSLERDGTEQTPLLQTPGTAADTMPLVSNQDHGENPMSLVRGLSIGFSLAVLIFLQTANVSLLTTIQSAIADGLNDYNHVSWFTSAYLIATASITPLAGRLCQIFRPQSYILASSSIFVVGLIVTATAPSLAMFLVGRVIAGIGAAANFPVAINVLISITSVKRRGLCLGGLNTCFTIGVAFGALIAGALEPAVGWRAVFWSQIPLALAGGFGVYFALPPVSLAKHNPEKLSIFQQLRSIDYLGSATLIALIVLLLFGLSSPKIQPIPIVVSIALLFAFVYVESRASYPIIPISVLRSRGTLMTCFATLGLMIARWSLLFYMPQYFIAVRSWAPAKAGLVLISTNGGFAVGGLLVGWLHIKKAGSYWLSTLVTFLLFAMIIFLQSLLTTPTSSIGLFFLCTFVNGMIVGGALNYGLIHVLHLTPASVHPIVTSLVAMFRGFAGSFGSAIGGGIFARVLRSSLVRGFAEAGLLDKDELIGKLLGSPRLVAGLSGQEQVVAQQSYSSAIATLFLAGSGLVLVASLLQAATGWSAPRSEDDAGKDVEEGEGRGVGSGD